MNTAFVPALVPQSDFIGLEGRCHLASGGEPPLLKAHQHAFDAFATDKADGLAGYERHWALADQTRALVSTMVGLPSQNIAFTGNASEGIARVLSAFDWRSGDNVITPSNDYPAGRFALSDLRRFGVDLRTIEMPRGDIDVERILAACDARTRLVYVSHVNSLTGAMVDVDTLSRALRTRGIALLLDASHTLGAFPVDARKCDFLVSSTYKFLCGPHAGIFCWNSDRWPDFIPMNAGRFSGFDTDDPGTYDLRDDARRVEAGNVPHLSLYLLKTSLEYLQQVPQQVGADHIRALVTRLYEGVTKLGLSVLTPDQPGARGPNVAIQTQYPRALVKLAAQDGILVWGDGHRLRASVHIFNSSDDIDQFLDWLPHGLSEVAGDPEPALWKRDG